MNQDKNWKGSQDNRRKEGTIGHHGESLGRTTANKTNKLKTNKK